MTLDIGRPSTTLNDEVRRSSMVLEANPGEIASRRPPWNGSPRRTSKDERRGHVLLRRSADQLEQFGWTPPGLAAQPDPAHQLPHLRRARFPVHHSRRLLPHPLLPEAPPPTWPIVAHFLYDAVLITISILAANH